MSFGIEEEFMFLDSGTLRPVDVGPELHHELVGKHPTSRFVTHEFLASQVERSSPVFHRMPDAAADLIAFRSRLALVSARKGVIAASTGTPFDAGGWPVVTNAPRYHTVESEFRGLVNDHVINGLHIHVGIPSRNAGVRALNEVRLWLPTLLALAGNSPYWRGVDTGFASWRAVHMRRWSTVGCPPPFKDAADYDRRIAALVGIGGTYDTRTIWWNARLAEGLPTLEVRVCDAQLDAGHTLFLACLTRALVVTALGDPKGGTGVTASAPELLDAALWHAARDGIGGLLVHPALGELRPAREVVDALIDYVADAVEDAGDGDVVCDGVDRVFRDGTGAQQQRAAIRAGGIAGLRKLLETALVARR